MPTSCPELSQYLVTLCCVSICFVGFRDVEQSTSFPRQEGRTWSLENEEMEMWERRKWDADAVLQSTTV